MARTIRKEGERRKKNQEEACGKNNKKDRSNAIGWKNERRRREEAWGAFQFSL